MRTTRKLRRIALALAVIFGVVTGTAAAVITSHSGGPQVGVDKRANDAPSSTSNTFWSDVPGGSLVVNVPANTSRLYDVSYFSESQCSGPNAGVCTIRIVAINLANGVLTELYPQSGADFAFDTDVPGGADDLGEAHAMERVIRLPGGANGAGYQIEVQYAVTNNTTTFTRDDSLMVVETSL
jgi:hypothetical protein